MSSFHLGLALSLVLPFTMFSQDSSKVHFIRASGEASVSAMPDRVRISVGVVSDAPTAESAAAQNASQSETVLKSLKAIVERHGEISTAGYSISPQYDFPNNHLPKLTGYQASNTVLVTLDDISLASKVIDEAASTGANNINNIEFTIRDREPLYAEALTQAAHKAKANAEIIAKALGLTLGSLLEATPQEPQIVIARKLPAMAQAAAISTPIETGSVEVRASVTVSFEVR